MDVAASDDVPVNLESVVTTSVDEENKKDRDKNEEESVDPPTKKQRFDENVKRVAEIILVLSQLREIRGGRSPTELEIELMVEAKSRLVDVCQELPPSDIFSKDAIGAMIEDLGLNAKLKDQRLGFTAPKLTISEKLALGKRKMEESKKNPIVLSSTFQGHSSSAKDVSVAHQWPNSAMKTSTNSVNAAESHFIKDASGITRARIETPQTSASKRPAVLAGNYVGNATSSFAQPQSSSSTRSFGTPSDSKVPGESSSRVTDLSIRPFMSQPPPDTFPSMKGVSYGQTSSSFGTPSDSKVHGESSSRVTDLSIRPFMFQPPPGTFPSMKGVSYGQTSSSLGTPSNSKVPGESSSRVTDLSIRPFMSLSNSIVPGESSSKVTDLSIRPFMSLSSSIVPGESSSRVTDLSIRPFMSLSNSIVPGESSSKVTDLSIRPFMSLSSSIVPGESSSRVTDLSIRPFISQPPPGTFPGMNEVISHGQTSSPFGNNQHAEIAKLIPTFMQPWASKNLLRNPFSREGMSRAIKCQICQATVNEVRTVVICDCCEKGYHVKCLEAQNIENVFKLDWHCPRCLQVYKGRTFRLQYGRVVSNKTLNMSSSTAKLQSSKEKRGGKMGQKVNRKARPHPEKAKPTKDSAMEQTVEADNTAMNCLVEAALSQIVEAEDITINQAVDATQPPSSQSNTDHSQQ